MRSEREVLIQTTERSSGRRERQTKEVSERERESNGRCFNLYFANKSFNPYTVHLHEACSLHLLLLLARK